MPGVLIVEAMAQTGGILVLSTARSRKLFEPIMKIKFKTKVFQEIPYI
jgi:3-hydroxymyristoyl/3-hydroxydecanoyl-(acyl carrier protein) dehydratase